MGRANSPHVTQPGPESGPGFQVEVFKVFRVVPSSLGSGSLDGSIVKDLSAFIEIASREWASASGRRSVPLKHHIQTSPTNTTCERRKKCEKTTNPKSTAPHHTQSTTQKAANLSPKIATYAVIPRPIFFFFFTVDTGSRRSLSLQLSDRRVYEPQIRARLGTIAHFYHSRTQ